MKEMGFYQELLELWSLCHEWFGVMGMLRVDGEYVIQLEPKSFESLVYKYDPEIQKMDGLSIMTIDDIKFCTIKGGE